MGTPFSTLGVYEFYQRDVYTHSNTPECKWEDVENRLTEKQQMDSRRCKLQLYRYENAEYDDVVSTLKEKMQRSDLGITVGLHEDNKTTVFIVKEGTRGLGDLEVGGEIPKGFIFSNSGQLIKEKDKTLRMLSMSMAKITSNVTAVPTIAKYSFEQFMDILRRLTKEQIETMKGNILMKSVKDRSDFEQTFMRAHAQLVKVNELRTKGTKNMCFNAFEPPFPIVEINDLINLTQEGTRLMEVSRETEKYILRDLFLNADVLNNYAVLILGSDRTTGYGKTQLALALACHYAKARCEALGLSKDEAKVVLSGTIDAGNEIEFTQGMVWVLDEFKPADTESQVYVTENMLKVLLSPRQSGTIRARNKDIKICEGVVRIITSNAIDGQDWCGKKIPWSDPLKRKSIRFSITKPLIPSGYFKSKDVGSNPDVCAISDLMASRLAPEDEEQPLPSMSSWSCPWRQ
jgi:hypothetical protein